MTRLMGRSLPPAKISFLTTIVFAFAVGALVGLATPMPWADEAIRAVFLIAVPAILAAATSIAVKRGIRYKQVMALALFGAGVYGVFYLLNFGRLFGANPYVEGLNLLLVGNGVVFALWFVVGRLLLNLRFKALLFALIPTTLNMLFLLTDASLALGSQEATGLLVKMYFASFIFLAATYALFWMINAPMKRNFGVSTVEAMSLFFAQWFEKSQKVERMFEEVGEEVQSLIGVAAFRAKGGMKALFIVPHVHFGPFGNVGGSEFPRLIAERLRDVGCPVLVFHGFATHDFNPVAASEVEKIERGVKDALGRMEFREARGWFAEGRSGTARCEGLRINGLLVGPLTRAPRTTEDIEFSVGLAIRNYALAKGAGEALLFDAHNAETGEITKVESGNPIGFEYMDAVADALAKKGEEARLKMGVAEDVMGELGVGQGIGGAGVKVMSLVADKEVAWVLVDANGVTPGFRREIIDAVRSMGVSDAEVFTTDTHVVNMVGGVLNPLGAKTDEKKFIEKVKELVKRARETREEVEFDGRLERFSIKVFGVAQASEFVGTVNSVVAIMRWLAPLALIGAIAASLWALTKIK